MNAQTPFNGDVQTYMERLPKVIESRYNELAAATDYQEYLSTYIENFLKQETVKGVPVGRLFLETDDSPVDGEGSGVHTGFHGLFI
jgi:hypothetical protein